MRDLHGNIIVHDPECDDDKQHLENLYAWHKTFFHEQFIIQKQSRESFPPG